MVAPPVQENVQLIMGPFFRCYERHNHIIVDFIFSNNILGAGSEQIWRSVSGGRDCVSGPPTQWLVWGVDPPELEKWGFLDLVYREVVGSPEFLWKNPP